MYDEAIFRIRFDHTVKQDDARGGYAVFRDLSDDSRQRLTPFFITYQEAIDAEKARKFIKNPPTTAFSARRIAVKDPSYVSAQPNPLNPIWPKCCPGCNGKDITETGKKIYGQQLYQCNTCAVRMLLPVWRGVNFTGVKTGIVTVLHAQPNSASDGHRMWLCECECGNQFETRSSFLTKGKIKSCGCLEKEAQLKRDERARQQEGMKQRNSLHFGRRKGNKSIKVKAPTAKPVVDLKDLTGQRFGSLVVVEMIGRDRSRNRLWSCQCDCGNLHTARSNQLISQGTKSCGCKNTSGRGARRNGRFIKPIPVLAFHAPAIIKRDPIVQLAHGEDIDRHIRQGLIPPDDLLNIVQKWKNMNSTSVALGYWVRPTILLPSQRHVSTRAMTARSVIHGRNAGIVERPAMVAFPTGVLSGILDQSSMSRSRLRNSRDTFVRRNRL